MENMALNYLNENESILNDLAYDIWTHPEVAMEEHYASQRLSDQLEQAGFSVTRSIGQMPTAFIATWGTGKPIIGILGEYDALPGLSQKVSAAQEPVKADAPGHGCGHNLLGVASMGAAIAVKEAMVKHDIKGAIRYYGCPAEETLSGKVYMAKTGVFDDLDAAITWHPGAMNSVWSFSLAALNSFKVNFHGRAAHAGSAPQAGRSALKAVQLMDIGVNYLREHITPQARIHCVITKGGTAPNIVPPYAQVWYYVRAPKRDQVETIFAWMLDVSKGATLMTQTTHDVEFLTGCYDMLPNKILGQLIHEKMKRVGSPVFTDKEMEFGRKLQANMPQEMSKESILFSGRTSIEKGIPFSSNIMPLSDNVGSTGGSTDVGDVSHITPTAQFSTCCQVIGAPTHSWQVVATSGSSIGFKGMITAAKVLALTALDLQTKPKHLEAAREEFNKTIEENKYISPLPENTVPG